MTDAWLLRKQTVHDVALTIGRGPRPHYVGLWVADTNSVLRACGQLAAAGYALSIERVPAETGSATPSSCTSSILTATASSSIPATTSPETRIISRCA